MPSLIQCPIISNLFDIITKMKKCSQCGDQETIAGVCNCCQKNWCLGCIQQYFQTHPLQITKVHSILLYVLIKDK